MHVINNPEKYVVNLSTHTPTKMQMEALAYALKYIICKRIKLIELQAPFKTFSCQLLELALSAVILIVSEYFKHQY